MPIVSVRRWNQTGHRSVLDEDSGLIIHKATGEEDPVQGRSGVYFMKMFVKRKLLAPKSNMDFGRPGMD